MIVWLWWQLMLVSSSLFFAPNRWWTMKNEFFMFSLIVIFRANVLKFSCYCTCWKNTSVLQYHSIGLRWQNSKQKLEEESNVLEIFFFSANLFVDPLYFNSKNELGVCVQVMDDSFFTCSPAWYSMHPSTFLILLCLTPKYLTQGTSFYKLLSLAFYVL